MIEYININTVLCLEPARPNGFFDPSVAEIRNPLLDQPRWLRWDTGTNNNTGDPKTMPTQFTFIRFYTHIGIRLIIVFLLVSSFLCPAAPARAQASTVCFTLPDRASHNVVGQVNSYWPGTANAAAGATTLALGVRRGAAVDIAYGDLLLVIQMQGAAINYENDTPYGSGDAANLGSGYLNNASLIAGQYEYVVARNATPISTGSLTIEGKGTGGGLMNAYTNSNSTNTQGQIRFQVIRVPAYLNVNLTGNVTAAAWDGTSGGIVALEVVNILTLGGNTLNVDGAGFRGGGGRQLSGYNSPDTDYRTRSTRNANGSKGEGIAGSPRYMYFNGALLDTAAPYDGYPGTNNVGGSYARGAPGNAGGGGTDGNPTANDQNSGGGGGGNGGTGGLGGNSWSSNQAVGGRNGAAFAERSASRLVMGGGGGAGTTNNGTGTPGAGLASSGSTGGGLLFLRIGGISGTGTITSNGANSLDVERDGTGGAGAGGSVLVIANGTATLTGLTINARGGTAGNAWPSQAPGGDPGERHGPGGGGGGGVVYTSSAPTSVSVNFGLNGTTTTAGDAYGSTSGAVGVTGTAAIADIPGAEAGFECYTPTTVGLTSLTASPALQPGWLFVTGAAGVVLAVAGVGLFRRKRNAH
jgi:hypothetical protein